MSLKHMVSYGGYCCSLFIKTLLQVIFPFPFFKDKKDESGSAAGASGKEGSGSGSE